MQRGVGQGRADHGNCACAMTAITASMRRGGFAASTILPASRSDALKSYLGDRRVDLTARHPGTVGEGETAAGSGRRAPEPARPQQGSRGAERPTHCGNVFSDRLRGFLPRGTLGEHEYPGNWAQVPVMNNAPNSPRSRTLPLSPPWSESIRYFRGRQRAPKTQPDPPSFNGLASRLQRHRERG